jgi:acetyl esterase/lipase
MATFSGLEVAMLSFVVVIALLLVLFWAIARFYLAGSDLRAFDEPRQPPIGGGVPSPEHHRVVESLKAMFDGATGRGSRQRLLTLRARMDELGAAADTSGVRIVPTAANGVPAEWVLAPGSASDCRLLYIHGGAFTVGSPRSHRTITTALARSTGAAVLAIDYRLMPEHRRRAGIEDCQAALRWIAARGPDGPAPARVLLVAGDSAGGNLTLMLLAWARQAGERVPDAAVAFSPGTDSTFASPSLARNVATDPMLGPAFTRALRVPRAILLWVSWLMNRIRPSDPEVSPVFGELAGLPPLLIHASEAEMLIDDARRYTNKARAAGSPVTLETWEHMVHVWHIFAPTLPEANAALERIGEFLRSHIARRRALPRAGAHVHSG